MTDTIIDGTKIDTSILSFAPIKAHTSGAKVVNMLNKHTKYSVEISTPLMLTWGAQEGTDPNTGMHTGKWTMGLQFPSTEYSTPEAEQFLKGMQDIETKVKETALQNSLAWFGQDYYNVEDPQERKFNQRLINEKFNVMLRHPKKVKGGSEVDTTRAPCLTVKIPKWSDTWKSEIYNEDSEPLFVHGKTNSHLNPLEFLKPMSHVICLIQCSGLWIGNGKVSITWNLKQAIVQTPRQVVEGTCLIKPKAADVDKIKTMPPPTAEANNMDDGPQSSDNVATLVEDTDDEEEENTYAEEPEPAAASEPEPVPAPVVAPVPPPVPPVVFPIVEVAPKTVVKRRVVKKVAS